VQEARPECFSGTLLFMIVRAVLIVALVAIVWVWLRRRRK
jgi:hypothetical protein